MKRTGPPKRGTPRPIKSFKQPAPAKVLTKGGTNAVAQGVVRAAKNPPGIGPDQMPLKKKNTWSGKWPI
jgi:hypothetical protein